MKAHTSQVLLGALGLVLAAANGAAQVTTRLGDTEASASILGFDEVTLFKDAADTNGQKRLVFVASGSIICTHPDFQDLQGWLDPKLYHHVKTDTNGTTIEAKAIPSTNHALLVTGSLLIVAGVGPNGEPRGFHTCSLFLPGAIWNVKEEIAFGFEDKAKGKLRRLAPGSYRIGPYGVPQRQASGSKPQPAASRDKVERGGAANGSQPIRSEPNPTSSAAGSRR